ncbi:hypothetical protein [Amphibiibacter pelophylacis]|uniref:Uncharacterized protein n=1 Tax=Amphibiibacter pelophylacis TaxID=1799477 RepID=A0ACC6NZY6_9BURK
MSWPNIIFTENEKVKLQEMAIKLEQRIFADLTKYKDLDRFSEYPPFVAALRLAKKKEISKPLPIPNTNYWYFETNLSDWMRAEGTGLLSKFLSAVEGFPYEEE